MTTQDTYNGRENGGVNKVLPPVSIAHCVSKAIKAKIIKQELWSIQVHIAATNILSISIAH